jgi:hypothetical protein
MAPGQEVKGYYAHNDKQGSSPGGTVTFEGKPVPQGCLAVLSFISVIDYTRTNRTLILGIRDAGGNDRYLRMVKTSTAYELHLEGPIILLEGERPIGIALNTDLADVLYFSAHGVLRAP